MSRTVKELRHRCARRIRDLWTGTLTTTASAASTQLTDSSRVEAANFFRNGFLHINADASAEDHRIASSASQTLTLAAPGLTAQQVSGTAYEIHKRFSVPEYNDYIQEAIEDSRKEAVLSNLDYTSITLAQDTYEYVIPTNFRYIREVWVADSNGDWVTKVPFGYLDVIPGTQRKLRFSRLWALDVGRSVRVLGQGVEPDFTLADTSQIQLDPAFLTAHVELALRTIIAGDDTGPEANLSQRLLRELRATLEMRRARMTEEHRPYPGSLVVPV